MNTADPDLHKDPASLRYCLCKWSFLYSLPEFHSRSKSEAYPTVRKCDDSRVIVILEADFLSADAHWNFEFHSEFGINFGTFFELFKPFGRGNYTVQ